MRRILVVCTGNLVRSPMAAALALEAALARSLDLEVRSAGTRATPGQPAHPKAIAALRERGVDLTEHRSRRLDAEDLRWAHEIWVMEAHHAVAARELAPELGETIVGLGPAVGLTEVADPMGSWFLGPYRATRDLLDRGVQRLLDR